MIKIYADFNSMDEQGRVRLSTVGSLADLERQRDALADGLAVVLYMDGEFEVIGQLVAGDNWKAVPDWETIRYLDEVGPTWSETDLEKT